MGGISQDRRRADALFRTLSLDVVRRWVALAEARLKGTGIRTLIGLGNDDLDDMEGILGVSDYVELTDGRLLHLDDSHELLTGPYSNITPWHTNRELTEPQITEQIAKAAGQLQHPERAVFNIHVPPMGTQLDLAPHLTADLTKIMGPGGEPEMVHVGSSAVRAAIEQVQPLLGLHGHIHESKGFSELGRTLCVNPGSVYSEGVLQGLYRRARTEPCAVARADDRLSRVTAAPRPAEAWCRTTRPVPTIPARGIRTAVSVALGRWRPEGSRLSTERCPGVPGEVVEERRLRDMLEVEPDRGPKPPVRGQPFHQPGRRDLARLSPRGRSIRTARMSFTSLSSGPIRTSRFPNGPSTRPLTWSLWSSGMLWMN